MLAGHSIVPVNLAVFTAMLPPSVHTVVILSTVTETTSELHYV